jgi:hypothetical protein
MWELNYQRAPKLINEDGKKKHERSFKTSKLEKLTENYRELLNECKKFNLWVVFPVPIAEINMGFLARISHLAFDTIDMVSLHKGEIAELIFRCQLETFIISNCLLKRRNPDLFFVDLGATQLEEISSFSQKWQICQILQR